MLDLGVCMGDGVDAHFVADFAPEGPPCLEVRDRAKKEGFKELRIENMGYTNVRESGFFDPYDK